MNTTQYRGSTVPGTMKTVDAAANDPEQARTPDRASLEAAIERELDRLIRQLERRGNGLFTPTTGADDLAHEAVCRLLRKADLPEFENSDKLRAYLLKTALRLLVKRRQVRDQQTRLNTAMCGELHSEQAAGEILRFENDEESSNLHALLAQLPEDDRKILELVYFEKHSLIQVAAEMEISRNTAARYLARARSRLAALMRSPDPS